MMITRAWQALLGTLLVVTVAATGCSESSPRAADGKTAKADPASAASAPAEYNMGVSGYPLDQTLDGLVGDRFVDTMVVISTAKIGEPRWIGRAGGSDGWEDAPGSTIVTPVDGSVSTILRGTANVGDPIRTLLPGGRVDEYEVHADEAARPEDIAKYSRLLVAGETTTSKDGLGQVLDPWFVYGIDADGLATGLMASASDKEPVFAMAELQARLKLGR